MAQSNSSNQVTIAVVAPSTTSAVPPPQPSTVEVTAGSQESSNTVETSSRVRHRRELETAAASTSAASAQVTGDDSVTLSLIPLPPPLPDLAGTMERAARASQPGVQVNPGGNLDSGQDPNFVGDPELITHDGHTTTAMRIFAVSSLAALGLVSARLGNPTLTDPQQDALAQCQVELESIAQDSFRVGTLLQLRRGTGACPDLYKSCGDLFVWWNNIYGIIPPQTVLGDTAWVPSSFDQAEERLRIELAERARIVHHNQN